MSLMEIVKEHPVGIQTAITVKEETVSDEAFEEIQKLLRANYGRRTPANFSRMFGDIKEKVFDAQLSGKFPTRIEQYYYKYWNTKVSKEDKERIGNIAAQSIIPESSYLISLSDKIDWKPGDFADTGSCYWRENQYAQKVLVDEGFRAVKIHTPKGDPLARGWMLWDNYEQPVLFNAYGIDLYLMAAGVSQLFNCQKRSINLTNNGETSRLLYINSGSGIVFYQNAYYGDYLNVDLHIDVEDYIENHHCSECNKTIEWNYIYFLYGNLNIFCEKCFEDRGGYA